MTAQVASSDTGMVTLGMMRGSGAAQEQEDHQHDERDADRHRELNVVDGCPDGLGAVAEHPQLDRRRQWPQQFGQRVLHPLHGLIDVVSGLLVHIDDDGPFAVEPRGFPDVLDAGNGTAEIAHAHRRAIAVGHDHRIEGRGVENLIGGVERHRLPRAVEGTFG